MELKTKIPTLGLHELSRRAARQERIASPGTYVVPGPPFSKAKFCGAPVPSKVRWPYRATIRSASLPTAQSETQPLIVKLDPREHVTQAQLEEQFKLASQVRDQVSQADEMVIKIRAINKEAKERADKANDSAISSAGASLRDKFSTIEEEIYQTRNRANEDPLNFPIKLNNQIAALARSIETGDNPPTSQDYEIFRILTARFTAVQAKFNDALKVDLGRFNELLASHNLAEIGPGGTPDHQ